MLGRFVKAVVVGVIAWLVCLLLGLVLGAIALPWVAAVAKFLTTYAGLISLVAAAWWFFTDQPA